MSLRFVALDLISYFVELSGKKRSGKSRNVVIRDPSTMSFLAVKSM